MTRFGSLVILSSLLVVSACGESEPQFVGTAHVLRVLERIETQQADAIERLAALEANGGGAVPLSMSSDPMPEQTLEPARAIVVETTVAFTEGPTVAEDGSVYFTDLGNNRIMRWSNDGQLSTYRQPSNRANGLIFDAQWRLLACEGGDGDTALPRITRTDLVTGEVEVLVDELRVLNSATPPPFAIEDDPGVDESVRLRHRVHDLRRAPLQNALQLRHRLFQAVRASLSEQGFLEIETPMLTRSTPEGARDFLVPSRMQPGDFYALPQSPQIFKQLLMESIESTTLPKRLSKLFQVLFGGLSKSERLLLLSKGLQIKRTFWL